MKLGLAVVQSMFSLILLPRPWYPLKQPRMLRRGNKSNVILIEVFIRNNRQNYFHMRCIYINELFSSLVHHTYRLFRICSSSGLPNILFLQQTVEDCRDGAHFVGQASGAGRLFQRTVFGSLFLGRTITYVRLIQPQIKRAGEFVSVEIKQKTSVKKLENTRIIPH